MPAPAMASWITAPFLLHCRRSTHERARSPFTLHAHRHAQLLCPPCAGYHHHGAGPGLRHGGRSGPVDRKSVVSGKSGSLPVSLGGRRIIKNKKITIITDT